MKAPDVRVSVEQILVACHWRCPNTFTSFYLKELTWLPNSLLNTLDEEIGGGEDPPSTTPQVFLQVWGEHQLSCRLVAVGKAPRIFSLRPANPAPLEGLYPPFGHWVLLARPQYWFN